MASLKTREPPSKEKNLFQPKFQPVLLEY